MQHTYRCFGGGGGTLNFTSGISSAETAISQQAIGTTILSGPNGGFVGNTTVTVGNLIFNLAYDNLLTAGSISVSSGASVGAGSTWLSGGDGTITNSFLPLISTSSAGSLALVNSTSENLSFASFGSLSLGANGSSVVNYSGALTPSASAGYRLGGGGGTLNFSGALPDVGGPTNLTVSGSGTVQLTNTGNLYSGTTTISGGATLSVGADTELGTVGSVPVININGGTLQASNSFALNPSRIITLGPASGSGSGTIDVASGANLSIASNITDANTGDTLVVTDTGTLVLSGTGGYTGGTTIQNGATVRTDPANFSLGGGVVTLNAGTLSLSGSTALTNNISVSNPLNITGETSTINVTGVSSASINGVVSILNSNLNITGDTGSYTLNLNGSVTIGGGPVSINVNNNGSMLGNLTLGPIAGSGTPQITFNGGNVTLTAAARNTAATGALPIGTTVTLGPNQTILNANASLALGEYSQMTVDSNATLNLGAAETISSLSGSGAVNLNGNTLTVGNLDNATGSFSGVISDGTGFNSALIANGGSVTLTGANTYSGGTTVNTGTLRIGNTATPAGSATAINLAGGSLGLIGAGSSLNNPMQSYAYDIMQTASGGISVSGSLAATVGDLSIGTSTAPTVLNITSPSATNSPYSLTFAGVSGITNLNGTTTVNISNSAGGGTGTVVLGSLNDSGTPQSITFGGSGRVQLNAAAQSLQPGTQVTLSNGLVSSASAPTTGLIGEYKFAEGSGTTANDSGSNGLPGQLVGTGAGYTTAAQVGPYALNLTSSNSFMQVPHSSAFALSSYTVSAWVNASSFQGQNATIFSTRNAGDTTFDIQISPSGLHGDVGAGNGTWLDTNVNLSEPINTNTWYLVTYSVSPSGTNVFVNGGTSATGGGTAAYTAGQGVYTTGNPDLESPATFITIGNQAGGVGAPGSGTSVIQGFVPGSQLFGQIDDVRVYNTALTQAQVAALYNLTSAGVTVNSDNATSLGSSAQLSTGTGTTFNVGASQQVQSLSGTGSVALGSNTLTVGSGDNQSSTFAGVITGNGGLTVNKSSTATLTLQNGPTASSYSGPTTITSGTLAVNFVKPTPTYSVIPNGNFFAPNLGGTINSYGYANQSPQLSAAQITAAAWTFTGTSGLAGVGSAFGPQTNGATFDSQFGFIQNAGAGLSQTLFLNPGTYNVGFYAAGRGGFGTNELDVYLIPNSASSPDNLNTGTAGTTELYANVDPPSTGTSSDWTLFNNGSATVSTAGFYTLDFLGIGGGDSTFLDDVNISTQAVTSSQVLSPHSAVVLSSVNSTLALNDNSQTIGSLTGVGNVSLGSLATTTLSVGADGTTPAPFTGLISGAGGVTVIGGTLTLGDFNNSGGSSNSYSGTTMVNGGTLVIANGPSFFGSATGSGPVIVNNGGRLAVTVAGGDGSIVPTGSSTVTVANGGTIALANGVTMSLGNGLTLSPGAIISADLTGTPNGIASATPLLAIPGGNFVLTSGTDNINLTGTPSARQL